MKTEEKRRATREGRRERKRERKREGKRERSRERRGGVQVDMNIGNMAPITSSTINNQQLVISNQQSTVNWVKLRNSRNSQVMRE